MDERELYRKIDLDDLYDTFTRKMFSSVRDNVRIVKRADRAEDLARVFDVGQQGHLWLCKQLGINEDNVSLWWYLKGVCDQFYQVWETTCDLRDIVRKATTVK